VTTWARKECEREGRARVGRSKGSSNFIGRGHRGSEEKRRPTIDGIHGASMREVNGGDKKWLS
jgi:hypothetical protein